MKRKKTNLRLFFYIDYLQYRKDRVSGSAAVIHYREKLINFKQLLETEKGNLGDETLQQEIEVMNKLISLEPEISPKENAATSAPESSPQALVNAPVVVEEVAAQESEAMVMVDDQSVECVICLTNKKNILLLPCKHLCLCSECANNQEPSQRIAECPLCRKIITDKVSVFV
jgi:hypothetical protein